jgi:hypothetical protein
MGEKHGRNARSKLAINALMFLVQGGQAWWPMASASGKSTAADWSKHPTSPRDVAPTSRTDQQRDPLSEVLQLGAMPLSVSSLIAIWFFDKCDKRIPRNTFGALVN